ncbi:nucleotidyltransferase [Alkalihalobacterium bogoriense]|uniref:nucleotidyltransferase n=1 Tax=Alkalihalobacterium bogoriense TaxID=246272 RepID=UPI00047BC2B7|nr:nucleotidyltransferase [Alkalihalobacterium bogoriense]
MKSTGVIVEYNPFHNGHLYHMEEARKQTNADVIIAVMSGTFLQRGEPALVSKWQRTKMALAGGADLVIELPYAYSTQKAETFAFGAISILHSLFTKNVCFGSESGQIEDFTKLLGFINTNHTNYNFYIQKFVKEGNSYPKACALAYKALQPSATLIDLSKPNNILGFHYIQAIHRLGSDITPVTILRKQAQYHDQSIEKHSIASATSIRNELLKQNFTLSSISHVVPETTYHLLQDYYKKYDIFHNWEQYFPLLKYRLLTLPNEQLEAIYEGEEGLHHRLKKHCQAAQNFSEFMTLVKTKRYTWNRIQRYCLHILTNTTKKEIEEATKGELPYIRILGMSGQGRQYLKRTKKRISVPMITRPTEIDHPLLTIDKRATACYALAYPPEKQADALLEDYATPPIQTKEESHPF